MRKLAPGRTLRWLVACAALGGGVGSAATASALSMFTLDLAPSSAVGGAPLVGSIAVAIGSLPLVGNTTLQLTDVSASAGGTSISLDPSIPTAGLGIAHADGSFLIPTLFLQVDAGGGPQDLAIPDVTGTLDFSDAGATLVRLETGFDVDAGDPPTTLSVHVVATPEPGAAGLLAIGLLLLSVGRAPAKEAR
jgi:hypothetical protein